MSPAIKRRSLCHWLCCAPALLGAPREIQAQEVPREWGDVWQPSLPGRERHPSLFYDGTARDRIVSRLSREPWKTWWSELQAAASPRSNAPFRWWLTGDEPAAQTARADLLGAPIHRQQPQGYLEPSSHHLTDYIAAYDLLASWPGLTPEDHLAIRSKVAAEAHYYYGILSGGPRGGANYGNQRTLGASALGIAALALCEYDGGPSTPRQWLARALYEIRREENIRFFREDGLFVEGAGYLNYMGLQLVQFAIAYERATGKYILEEPRLRDSLVFSAYQMLASGDVIPWGTCEVHGTQIFALLSNARYGREMAPLFGWAFGRALRPSVYHRHIALAHYDGKVAGEMPPASRVFPGSHTVVFRDNWGDECVSVWFAGKEPGWWNPRTYATYSHGDCGSFVLAMGNEVLATDSGYDHWKSRDYYGAKFHNVLLIDGEGPTSQTTGEMSHVETQGRVRHATVTTEYQGCTVRRTLALVRGRYVAVADRVLTDTEHEYTWQVRSTCAPDAPGTKAGELEVTWPGITTGDWRNLTAGRAQLTTVIPRMAKLSLAEGRWRPRSAIPEFRNQVALATWRAADTIALFTLIPNLKDRPEVTWTARDDRSTIITGPGWTDTVWVEDGALRITSSDGRLTFSCEL